MEGLPQNIINSTSNTDILRGYHKELVKPIDFVETLARVATYLPPRDGVILASRKTRAFHCPHREGPQKSVEQTGPAPSARCHIPVRGG